MEVRGHPETVVPHATQESVDIRTIAIAIKGRSALPGGPGPTGRLPDEEIDDHMTVVPQETRALPMEAALPATAEDRLMMGMQLVAPGFTLGTQEAENEKRRTRSTFHHCRSQPLTVSIGYDRLTPRSRRQLTTLSLPRRGSRESLMRMSSTRNFATRRVSPRLTT